MRTFNFIDTKFLAINGDLLNTVSGGTAMLNYNFYIKEGKYIIEAKIPSTDIQFMTIELIKDQLIISASIQTISDSGVVFNLPFGSNSFDIPKNVDESNIIAFERNGKLIVELPISDRKRPRNRNNIDISFDDDF